MDQCDKLLGEESSLAVQSLAKQVYEFASSYAASRGILVADTKMEFGTLPGASASDLIVGDEVLTPDCSRYWPQETNPQTLKRVHYSMVEQAEISSRHCASASLSLGCSCHRRDMP